MLCSEIETSSLSHPLSPYYLSSSPLFFRFPPTSCTSLPIYLPVSVCISLTRPSSFCLSHMACHLCDKWTSFFSGNSPMMDFSSVLCVCAVFFVFPSFCFPTEVAFVCFAELKHRVFFFPCFFLVYIISKFLLFSNADRQKREMPEYLNCNTFIFIFCFFQFCLF